MKNIFKNAFFGKAYKTRDGRKAVYLGDNTCWIEGGETEIGYSRNGLFVDFQEHGIDIISEWQEEINEAELEEFANYATKKDNEERRYEYRDPVDIGVRKTAFKRGYKAGYRKAKEQ